MNQINDGGSAFPEVSTDIKGERGDYRSETYSAGGMTLRDYFAAQMAPIIGRMIADGLHEPEVGGKDGVDACIATDAYRIADAMLKARQS